MLLCFQNKSKKLSELLTSADFITVNKKTKKTMTMLEITLILIILSSDVHFKLGILWRQRTQRSEWRHIQGQLIMHTLS